VVADKAYNSRSIGQYITDQGALAVIPTKSNAKTPIPHNKALYRMRNYCRAVLVHHEGHEKANHALRKNQLKLFGNGAYICHSVMGQLSPHPRS